MAIAENAGLGGELTAHVFRRSCASELVKGNASIYHVSRMLGHESLDTLKRKRPANPPVAEGFDDIK